MSEKPPPGAPPLDLQAEVQKLIPRLLNLFKFAWPHRVRYEEIGAQGVVGSAAWVNLLQLGRLEYLRNLGLMSMEGGTAPVQAIVRTSALEYLAPARFDEALLLRVRASYLGHKSCRFEFLADGQDTGLRHAVGEMALVCVEASGFKSIAWPQVWRDRISEFEGEDLRQGQK